MMFTKALAKSGKKIIKAIVRNMSSSRMQAKKLELELEQLERQRAKAYWLHLQMLQQTEQLLLLKQDASNSIDLDATTLETSLSLDSYDNLCNDYNECNECNECNDRTEYDDCNKYNDYQQYKLYDDSYQLEEDDLELEKIKLQDDCCCCCCCCYGCDYAEYDQNLRNENLEGYVNC